MRICTHHCATCESEILDGKVIATVRSVLTPGKSAVIDMLADPTGSPDIAMHSFTNPIITVSGDTATGNWLIWVAQKVGDENNQVFQSEDLVYERVDSEWRIKSIDLHFGTILTGAQTADSE